MILIVSVFMLVVGFCVVVGGLLFFCQLSGVGMFLQCLVVDYFIFYIVDYLLNSRLLLCFSLVVI